MATGTSARIPVSRAHTTRPVRLSLLGTFVLTEASGQHVTIASPRAQSLVAYLVLHRGAAQPRRQIASALWPDSSEAQAHNSLRQLVHQLRRAWPDAHQLLDVRGGTLALGTGADDGPDLEVDVDRYEMAVAAALAIDDNTDPGAARTASEHAADLYRGAFLTGIDDEWVDDERGRLSSIHERVLDRLIGLLERAGDYGAAIERAEQRLRIDPLDEGVVRWLMRLHALNQDLAGALRVYEASAAVLLRELGVEPDQATRAVHGQVLALHGGAPGVSSAAGARSILRPRQARSDREREAARLIGRAAELARATAAWDRMAVGEAQLVVIGGEPGIGKSRLAAELCDWSGRRGGGSTTTRAYEAEGRLAFAPIADWLRSELLAVVLPRLDRTALTEISRLLPELLTQRPDVARPSVRIEDWQRQPFFQALVSAVRAASQPIVLVLDDLQWCDADTLEWLHFLLRVEAQARVLVVGTVRPNEAPPSQPLVALVQGLREAGRLTEIDLGPLSAAETTALASQVAGRALLPEQARRIHVETEGNPLFVVETIRAGLIDATGSASSEAVQSTLPPKVKAIIASRLDQLSEPARNIASLAATVGRAFPVEVLRVAGSRDEDRLVAAMDELIRRQIIREQGNGEYDFTHDKIREVAYSATTEARRRLLHRRVAEALERIHASDLDTAAAGIAGQWANAGLIERGAPFYLRAAAVAQRIGGNLEAISLLHRALTLLESVPPSPARDEQELALQASLGVSLVATQSYGSADVRTAFGRARQLCQLLGQPPPAPILRGLALASLSRPLIAECHALGDHLMVLADQADDPVLRVEAHFVIAASLLMAGSAVPAREHLEASLAHYDRSRSTLHIGLYSQDPAVVCLIRLSLDLWVLGEPDAADQRRAESLALATELGHPFTMAYALVWDSIQQTLRGDPTRARAPAEAATALGREHRMPLWLSLASVIRGWAMSEQGDGKGIDELERGMADFAATGSGFTRPFQLGLLAASHARLGRAAPGLDFLDEALAIAERTDERWYEPELHRLRGDLLQFVSREADAELAYGRAIEVARYQGARAFEERSAMRLAELHQRDGSGDDADPVG